MYRRCLELLADREAARDATQSAFVELLGHEPTLEDLQGGLAELRAAATRQCARLRRARPPPSPGGARPPVM